MTGDLIKIEQFQDTPVRVIRHGPYGVIPLNDIADALCIDRSGFHKLFKRHAETLARYGLMVKTSTSQGDSSTLCLTREGVVGLILKTKPGASKSQDAQDRIIAFQTWAIETISKIMNGERVRVSLSIDEELVQARHLAEQTGGNLASFQAIALKKCGFGDYVPALNIPQIIHGEIGWFNPTRLVALCNDPDLTPERLNWYLKNKGFQYRDGYIWRLTPLGMAHGKEYWYTASSQHQEIRIAWRESVLFASGLKRPISTDQAALPARA